MSHSKFKIEFGVMYYDGLIDSLQYPTNRVVMAVDNDQARRVAQAMLGEEVDANEYLHSVISVESTIEEPTGGNALGPEYTWKRISHYLKLDENERAEPIYYNGMQVGIEFMNK